MGRLLAIDYGRKRTGIAVTDSMQIIASGLTTVRTCDLFTFLEKYFKDEEVDSVVIGYPMKLNNQPTDATKLVDDFIKRFEKKFNTVPIYKVDERFTSSIAFQSMIDGGVKKEKRQDKELVDMISATLILQSFMERNKKV